MYKNNWIKRGAVAAVAAGLMLGALPGVAMAEGETPAATINDGSQAIIKNFDYGTSILAQNNTFQVKLTYNRFEDIVSDAGADPVKVGTSHTKDITVADDDGNSKTTVATGRTTLYELVSQFNITKPGMYFFTLEEVNPGNNPDVQYDSDTYTVRVDYVNEVDENTGVPTGNIVLSGMYILSGNDKTPVKPNPEAPNSPTNLAGKLDSVTFDNRTTASSDPVTVKKVVKGTAADTAKHFRFSITITGAKANGSYAVTSTAKDEGDIKSGTVQANDQGVITLSGNLKNDEQVSIAGLPENAKVEVKETGADGYKESYAINGKAPVVNDVADGKDISTGELKVKDNKNIVFYNEKGFIPETGITMNTLPFIGVAAVAAAGAVTLVISRKRRAGEEF